MRIVPVTEDSYKQESQFLLIIFLGSCDPYVKIHLIPDEKFASVPKPKTKTQKKTSFPLFDEVFSL